MFLTGFQIHYFFHHIYIYIPFHPVPDIFLSVALLLQVVDDAVVLLFLEHVVLLVASFSSN